jgi:hypothetical protein
MAGGRLLALICAFNEEELLPGCLDSLAGRVDRVVLADGRYARYPGEGPRSTDGTPVLFLELARERGLAASLIPAPGERPWETEAEKRTALVRAGELGDQYLVIDADERLAGEGELRELFGDYRVQVRGIAGTPGRQDAVRLFAHRDGLTYRWHFGLFTAGGMNLMRTSAPQLAPGICRIEHLHSARSAERVADDKRYEEWLVPHEAELGAYG